jgi:hypothetical protein
VVGEGFETDFHREKRSHMTGSEANVLKTYTHAALDEEVSSISGWYALQKEERMELSGREILYLVGQAVVDGSCCGYGGCRYAVVPGFVAAWKSGTDSEGFSTSVVEPIKDQTVRDEIRRLIEGKEGVSQVQFW